MPGGGYAADWSRLHHGVHPSPLVSSWLRLMWALARPLARAGVPPMAVTLAGVVLAVDAVFLAGPFPLAASALVLGSAVCDGLDGAVAVVAGRATRAGALADALADRIADCAYALVIWRCGAPFWLAVLAGGISLVHETVRVAGDGALRTTITVGERPTRVICTGIAGIAASLSSADWPATACAAVWSAAGLVALGQLLRRHRGE